MWPFEARREVLRIGRHGAELWRHRAQGLALIHSTRVDSRHDLAGALHALFAAQPGGRGGVDVLLESAWLPVLLLETGPDLWSRDTVQGLLRHRLERVYDERDDAVASWGLAVDHRPGERFGIGFGLSPRVQSTVNEACAAAGRQVASMQPMWQWARRRLAPQEGWWMWMEQDRALVALLARGQVVALQPAADVPVTEAQAREIVRIEQVRAGLGAVANAIPMAGWQAPFTPIAASEVSWRGVAAPNVPAVALATAESAA